MDFFTSMQDTLLSLTDSGVLEMVLIGAGLPVAGAAVAGVRKFRQSKQPVESSTVEETVKKTLIERMFNAR